MAAGGIVLCGGQSSRMGTSKALLPFGPETMLQRVVRLLRSVVNPVVIVAAPEQALPELPDTVVVARDERSGRGPLEGLRAGWRAMPDPVEIAYVTSCDVPLIEPAFVTRMLENLSNCEIAAVQAERFLQPLAAAYRRSTLPVIEQMLANDDLRVTSLLERVPTRRVRPEEVTDIDPKLWSLWNLNTPDDYEQALLAYHEGR